MNRIKSFAKNHKEDILMGTCVVLTLASVGLGISIVKKASVIETQRDLAIDAINRMNAVAKEADVIDILIETQSRMYPNLDIIPV